MGVFGDEEPESRVPMKIKRVKCESEQGEREKKEERRLFYNHRIQIISRS